MSAKSETRVTRARGWIRAGVEARGRGPELLAHREWEGPAWLLGSISRAIGKEPRGLVWGGGVRALGLLVQLEEHLLLPLLLVQIVFQSLRQREGRCSSVRSLGHKSSNLRTPTKVAFSGNFPPGPWGLGHLVFPLSFRRAYHPESKHHPLHPPATAT